MSANTGNEINVQDVEQESAIDWGRRRLARFMAVEDPEWDVISADRKLGAEIVFQALAVLFCSLFFGWAIYNIALNLLGYPFLGAVIFSSMAAFGLGAIDRHVRIQTRGVPNASRAIVYKVRFASILIVAISGVLLATSSFREDIERIQFEKARQQRAVLEASPQYATSLEIARNGVSKASRAMERADELQREIARIGVEQAKEIAARRDECLGNTTGNQLRLSGCGPKARGHETAAQRLGQELDVSQAALRNLGNVPERLEHARRGFDQVNARIDRDIERSLMGASKKLDAFLELLATHPAAALTTAFWILVGMLPDIMMWIALSRSANDASFAKIREVQEQTVTARIAKWRARMRAEAADGLAPLEFRLTAVPSSLAKSTGEASGETQSRVAS